MIAFDCIELYTDNCRSVKDGQKTEPLFVRSPILYKPNNTIIVIAVSALCLSTLVVSLKV